jgi:cyclic beta-1,2-glucan synthetase
MTSGTSILGHLTQFRGRLRSSGLSHKPSLEELPLRSELFSADQMERHGKTLATAHRVTPDRARDQLLPRLASNESVLIDGCKGLAAAIATNRRITPAGEWLLDNFHLIGAE